MYIGIDVGGTKCAAVCSEDGKAVCNKIRFATKEKDKTLERIVQAVEILGPPSAIGISCGGPLDENNGVFLGISTSGNAKNVCAAAETAKAKGMKTVAMTGASGGRLAQICEIALKVPETETYQVQELHLPLYHALCAEAEARIFGGEKQ